MFYLSITLVFCLGLELLFRISGFDQKWSARLLESVLAFTVGALAFLSVLAHINQQLPLQDGITSLGLNTLNIALGFFIYHLHRVIDVPGYTKGLIFHHVCMILIISISMYFKFGYFYILVSCIPISSAAIRNLRWFWKKSGFKPWKLGAKSVAWVYICLESIAPLFALIHFLAVGRKEIEMAPAYWIFIFVPGVLMTILTLHWSKAFYKAATLRFKKDRM